jgi:hypothetical protein
MKKDTYQCWLGAGLSAPLLEARLVKITENEAIVCLKCDDPLPPVCDLLFAPSSNIGRKCRVVSHAGNVVRLEIKGRTIPDRETTELVILPD